MSSIYNGIDAYPVGLTIPSDGDGPGIKAADVNTPIEGLANRTTWLQRRSLAWLVTDPTLTSFATSGTTLATKTIALQAGETAAWWFTGRLNCTAGTAAGRVEYYLYQGAAPLAVRTSIYTELADKGTELSYHGTYTAAATAFYTLAVQSFIPLAAPGNTFTLQTDGFSVTRISL